MALTYSDFVAFMERVNPYKEQTKENSAFVFELLLSGLKITSAGYAGTEAVAAVLDIHSKNFFYFYGGLFFVFNAIHFSHHQLSKKHNVANEPSLALKATTYATTASNIASETVENTVMMALATLAAFKLETEENPSAIAGIFSSFFALNFAHAVLLHYFKDHPEKEPALHKVFNRYVMNSLITAGLSQMFWDNWLYNGPGNVEDRQTVAIGSISAGLALNLISATTETVLKNCADYTDKSFDSFHLWMLRFCEIFSLSNFIVLLTMNTLCTFIDCNIESYATPLTAMFVIFNAIAFELGFIASLHVEETKPHRAAPSYIERVEFLVNDPNNDNDRVDIRRTYGTMGV